MSCCASELINKLIIKINCRMFELMGYKPEHLLGKSLFDYHHGNDSENLLASFKSCKYFFKNDQFIVK